MMYISILVRESDFVLVCTFEKVTRSSNLLLARVFFYTTCTKLDLAHAFLFERVRNRALRTECQK